MPIDRLQACRQNRKRFREEAVRFGNSRTNKSRPVRSLDDYEVKLNLDDKPEKSGIDEVP